MANKSLIPEGFKDHVDFNTNVEHEYKNKIIDIVISNGFDLIVFIELKNKFHLLLFSSKPSMISWK